MAAWAAPCASRSSFTRELHARVVCRTAQLPCSFDVLLVTLALPSVPIICCRAVNCDSCLLAWQGDPVATARSGAAAAPGGWRVPCLRLLLVSCIWSWRASPTCRFYLAETRLEASVFKCRCRFVSAGPWGTQSVSYGLVLVRQSCRNRAAASICELHPQPAPHSGANSSYGAWQLWLLLYWAE
jgi:hypothetical protein